MIGKKQIIFKNGCFGGLRFTEISSNEFNTPELLVSGLKRLRFQNPDLDLFFARCSKDISTKDLFWEINEHYSSKTFEFYSLEDLPDQSAEIERRSDIFKSDLQDFCNTIKPISTEDRKILEALSSILANFSSRKLYAGYDETNKTFFPVIVGWGGKFQLDSGNSGELMGRVSEPAELSLGKEAGGTEPESEVIVVHSVPTRSYHPLYWFIWLAILILSLLIITKFIPSCGLKWVANTCPIEGTYSNKINDLDIYLQKLTRQSLVQNNICLRPQKAETSAIDEVPDAGDLEIKSRLDRESVASSEISVSLAWDTKEDLDLYVICPNNMRVSFKKKSLAENKCGDLDVDANFGSSISVQPIEHIVLQPFVGTYKIIVESRKNNYSSATNTPTKVKVEVKNFGKTIPFEGIISTGKKLNFSFDRQP